MIQAAPTRILYHPRGSAADVFRRREPEVLLCGPAGTGKSMACLWKLHLAAVKYPGMRGLMLRRVRADMHQSAQETYERKVLGDIGIQLRAQEQEYRYPNGSVIVVAGLDRPGKVMSAEYDLAYIQEATDLDTEDAWEQVTSRLRNWTMPYQQLIADCNPSSPQHWLKKRCDEGRTVMLESRHEDNPRLFDGSGAVTPEGEAYIAKLDALTGVRYLRLRKGIWAAAEGMVYGDDWDRSRNYIDPPASWDIVEGRPRPPRSWTRYWGIDFGFTNPFVWAAYAEDPDGRLYRYLEVYRTQRIVEDHVADIHKVWADEPFPARIICDHDAEDRATFERHAGRLWGRPVRTQAAHKPIAPGIDAVRTRWRPAADGKARLFLIRGALVYRDPELVDAKKPTCTEEEIEGYVYPTPKKDRPPDEDPIKMDDHGMDQLRYVVATLDLKPNRQFVSL